jgi:hypothetical protein
LLHDLRYAAGRQRRIIDRHDRFAYVRVETPAERFDPAHAEASECPQANLRASSAVRAACRRVFSASASARGKRS